MKPIEGGNPDVEVEMKPTGDGMKDILYFAPNAVVKRPDIACFDLDAEVKTVDNDVGMKPPVQILVERFYFCPITKSLMFIKPIFGN